MLAFVERKLREFRRTDREPVSQTEGIKQKKKKTQFSNRVRESHEWLDDVDRPAQLILYFRRYYIVIIRRIRSSPGSVQTLQTTSAVIICCYLSSRLYSIIIYSVIRHLLRTDIIWLYYHVRITSAGRDWPRRLFVVHFDGPLLIVLFPLDMASIILLFFY